jgi:hypothetical protein
VTKIQGQQKIMPDPHEPDDTYLQANVVTLNAIEVQSHSFHAAGDADWVKFHGLSGQTYVIRASNVGVTSNMIIELFDSDGTSRLMGPLDKNGDGRHEVMKWYCTRNDVYYVRLSNAHETFGENCKYDLKIYRPIGPLLGYISGSVIDKSTDEKIADAWIYTDHEGESALCQKGDYVMLHYPGKYAVTVEATGYIPQSYPEVQIGEGITELDFFLTPDSDNDGIANDAELASTCLDANDPDTDKDGLRDGEEDINRNGIVDSGETDPCHKDTDGDHMPDGWEVTFHLNPLVADGNEDADGDGCTNWQEYIGNSNPSDPFSLPKPMMLPYLLLLLFDD